ncbi:hypothetical protein PINS_up000558 [Pythium insidiosum]|nr:hypothetical protein PINS_up000558 [Pythium insidiosum]
MSFTAPPRLLLPPSHDRQADEEETETTCSISKRTSHQTDHTTVYLTKLASQPVLTVVHHRMRRLLPLVLHPQSLSCSPQRLLQALRVIVFALEPHCGAHDALLLHSLCADVSHLLQR